MKLHYKQYGKGKPVVILHGIFGMLDNWQSFARALSTHYKVYVPDMRNHGKSPHSQVHTYEAMTDDLLEFFKTHAIEEVAIIGHSMGGKTAMMFAQRSPDLTSGLLVIDIAPTRSHFKYHHIINALKQVDFNRAFSRKDVDDMLKREIPQKLVRQWLEKSLYWQSKNKLGWRFNLLALANAVNQMGKPIQLTPFSKPACFVKGAFSDHIKKEDIPVIKTFFPDSEIVTINHSGHWVHYDNPRQLLEITWAFLKKSFSSAG